MQFTTKRFLYRVLSETVCGKNGCNAVTGARKVGKTVLFLQLSEYFGAQAGYFDCTALLTDTAFDFQRYYETAAAEGKKILFLDEVCKINDFYLADFIKYTKLYASELCIMITGSVAAVVKKRFSEIGRGSCYHLPPLMYIERLCWNHHCDEVDLETVRAYTGDEQLKTYLKNQMMTPMELLGYMQGVVEDTVTSYRVRTYLEDNHEMEDSVLLNALKYISLCQYVYKKKNGEYVSIPSVEREVRERAIRDYQAARKKWGLTSREIEDTVSLLLGAGLARRTGQNRNGTDGCEPADRIVPDMVFEYPWYSSVCFAPEIQESEALLSQWIEYAILLRASYLYPYVHKYRSNEETEIDVVYMTDDYSGIEVKDRPYKNNSDSYLKKERMAAAQMGLKSFLISSSDGDFRNDKLIACMELEYMTLLSEGSVYSGQTVEELLSKYNI